MSQIQLISSDQPEWNDILRKSYQHDFYHLTDYHKLSEIRNEGRACLYVFREKEYTIALPLLIRQINKITEFENIEEDWLDATSVYGYPGPVSSHQIIPEEIILKFQNELTSFMCEQKIVSVFSRLHPIIKQNHLLNNLGNLTTLGETISINLQQTSEEQLSQYSRRHKRNIKRLREMGAICIEDKDFIYYNEFVDVYCETMLRVHAKEFYFFDKNYFDYLKNELRPCFKLFVTLLNDKVMSAGLYIVTNGLVHSHLGGERAEFFHYAPTKLEIDFVREWGMAQNFKRLHLGGGVGNMYDSLFEFKAGFSDSRHEFNIWTWAVNSKMFKELNDQKKEFNIKNNIEPKYNNYFPYYRCP